MKRKGLSLIQTLIVLAMSATLTTMALPYFNLNNDNLIWKSMKNDMDIALNVLEGQALSEPDYSKLIDGSEIVFTDTNDNGVAEETFKDNTKVVLSKGNSITFIAQTCSTGESGFIMKVSNSDKNFVRSTLDYNSCTSSGPYKNITS